MDKYKKKKGFTLIELMVVITLITILLSIVIVSAQKQKSLARDRVRVADINSILLAIEEYKLNCGEYPNKIELNTNNGNCPNGITLESFLPSIPVAPYNPDSSFSSSPSIIDGSGYLYAGLSTSKTGRCYGYHIAAELERNSKFLSEDSDSEKNSGKYNTSCSGSNPDFNGKELEEEHLYDLRGNLN